MKIIALFISIFSLIGGIAFLIYSLKAHYNGYDVPIRNYIISIIAIIFSIYSIVYGKGFTLFFVI